MKKWLTLAVLLLAFMKVNAQNRWMYLTKSSDSTVYMVDTLGVDIKRTDFYDGHRNVILIWIKSSNKITEKNETWTRRFAVDTTINQMEVKSYITYQGGKVVKTGTIDHPSWYDVVPESVGESFVEYCRALNDKKLMFKVIVRAAMRLE